MTLQIESHDGIVVVEGELTIYYAQQAREQLFPLIAAAGSALTMDLSQVTEFDTAGLQLLLMAQRTAVAAGCRCTIRRPSSAVTEVLTLCQCDELHDQSRTAA